MQQHETATSFYAFVATVLSAVAGAMNTQMQSSFCAADLEQIAKSWCNATSDKRNRAIEEAHSAKDSADMTTEENRLAHSLRTVMADNMDELHSAMCRLASAFQRIAANNRRYARDEENARVEAKIAKEDQK